MWFVFLVWGMWFVFLVWGMWYVFLVRGVVAVRLASFVARVLLTNTQRVEQVGQVRKDPRDSAEEVDRRCPLFLDMDGDFGHANACSLRPDHEFRGKEIPFDSALPGHGRQSFGLECLEPMGVGSMESEQDPKHAVDHLGRCPTDHWPRVLGAGHGFGSDDEIRLVRFEQG